MDKLESRYGPTKKGGRDTGTCSDGIQILVEIKIFPSMMFMCAFYGPGISGIEAPTVSRNEFMISLDGVGQIARSLMVSKMVIVTYRRTRVCHVAKRPLAP